MSSGIIRISIAAGTLVSRYLKTRNPGGASGARFSVRARRDTYGFADVVLHHDRGFVS